MKRMVLGLALLAAGVSFAYAAPPLTTSGVSAGSAFNDIGAPRANWDAAQPDDWLVFWLKLPSGTDLKNNLARYQYKITYTSPDKTGIVTEGPSDFDSLGFAKVSKQVSFFGNIRTRAWPQPNRGKWLAKFTLIDNGNGGKEEPGALLSFNLTGNAAGGTMGLGTLAPYKRIIVKRTGQKRPPAAKKKEKAKK